MDSLSFNIIEIIALLGLAQSSYILVFMGLRWKRFSRVVLPILFFLILFCAFFTSLAEDRIASLLPFYEYIKWFSWTAIAPASVLLILQIAQITDTPRGRFWAIFLFMPLALFGAITLGNVYENEVKWLYISSVFVGGLSLITLWQIRNLFEELSFRKNGRERYWLIIALVILNLSLLAINLFLVKGDIGAEKIEITRNILGISFIYIVSTSIFRLFPQTTPLKPRHSNGNADFLSDSDVKLALKIEDLLHVEKVYQEPSYKRSDLAQELKISEAHLSKIVNNYFEKSVPQLLNTYRVADAKYLLKETQADIATISEEAGFNSIATFNRVFKDLSSVTPSHFREIKK